MSEPSGGQFHALKQTFVCPIGPVPSPFDCYMVNRSLKTLKLRMEEHQKNGLIVARFLETHPLVEKVQHLLLPSHPQHELVKKQQYGHSGMLSFYLKGKYSRGHNSTYPYYETLCK